MQMVMTSDETQIQIFADWPMSHAKRVTRDNRKNPEYRVFAAIRKLRTDTNCPAGKSWQSHVKNEQHIVSEKTYGPQNTEQFNIMMQKTGSIFVCGPCVIMFKRGKRGDEGLGE